MPSGTKGNKGNKKGGRVRHDQPIAVKGAVDELPPRSHSSAVAEIIEQVKAGDGSWIELDPAGRQPNSVQSMIVQAAKKRKLDIESAVRGNRVFARTM